MKKILVVDDERDVLEVLGTRLNLAGFEVVRACCGKDCIDKAKKEQPDLIILDILMPDMGGDEVAQVLKNNEVTKDIPIIFLTCLFTKQNEKNEGHLVGKNIFVAKPYDIKELLQLISTTIK